MTPTPREDTMAEQTDQIIERMRTRAMVAGQCSVEAPDNVHSSMAAAEAEFLTECADLLAAQVRERDAAILRYQTAELEQNAVIAHLSAQVEQQKADKWYWVGVAMRDAKEIYTLLAERDAERQRWMDARCREVEQSIRADRAEAERDAAQQQIARLRAENASFTAAATVRVESAEAKIATLTEMAEANAQTAEHLSNVNVKLRDEVNRLYAALQSTRPQEEV